MSNKNINRIVLDGRIVQDCSINASGTILRFCIASNEAKKNEDGTWEDYANFFDVNMFGKSVKNLAEYLKKGKRIIVDGHLHQDRWEKDGKKQARVVINAENIVFVGGTEGNSKPPASRNNTEAFEDTYQGGEFPEDIPF